MLQIFKITTTLQNHLSENNNEVLAWNDPETGRVEVFEKKIGGHDDQKLCLEAWQH